MDKVRVGVVGCGLISKLRHIPAYKSLSKKVDLIAVCDLNSKLAEDVANEMVVPNHYSSVTEMLSEQQLDIVDICVPPKVHAPVAIEAMEKGCHVIMEKPMALTTADCDKMIEKATSKGLKLCTIHNDVFHPPFLKARELVSKGDIGDFTGMRIYLSTPRADMIDLENHWYHKLPGGVIGETGPHMAYMTGYFLKNVERVFVSAQNYLEHPWALRDHFTIVLEGENGTCSTTLAYTHNYWCAYVDLLGTKKTLSLDLEGMTVKRSGIQELTYYDITRSSLSAIGQAIGDLGSNVAKGASGKLRTGTHEVILRFIDSVLKDSPIPVTPEEGREAVRIMELVVKEYTNKYGAKR